MLNTETTRADGSIELFIRPLREEDAKPASQLMRRRFQVRPEPALCAHQTDIERAARVSRGVRGVGAFLDPEDSATLRSFAIHRNMEFPAEPGRRLPSRAVVRTLTVSDQGLAGRGVGLRTAQAADLLAFAVADEPLPQLLSCGIGDPDRCSRFQSQLGGVAFQGDSYALAGTPEFRALDRWVRDELEKWEMAGERYMIGATDPYALIQTARWWIAATLEPIVERGHRRIVWNVATLNGGRGGYNQVIEQLASGDPTTLTRLLASTNEFWGRPPALCKG